MKFLIPLLTGIAVLCNLKIMQAQVSYDDYFTENVLRYDFLFTGDKDHIHIFPVALKMESSWAGSRKILIDPLGYGNFRYRVNDHRTGELIFSMGFSSLFQEWQTTNEAKKMERAYYQALFFPFPKQKVVLNVEFRDRNGIFQPLFESQIDPADYFIGKEIPAALEFRKVMLNGKPECKIDLVFLADGYERNEKKKFYNDVQRLTDSIFAVAPFTANRDRFNVTALFSPSEESGVDIPGEGIYRNTAMNSNFYTFDIDRYLTTSDMKSVYDAAACVPWDFLVVLVNTDRYGGGGIYRQLTVCSSGHQLSPKVLIHELGHSFAGLADEYYSSAVAYEEFYPLTVEPWEPNITTLVNFGVKWKNLVQEGVPVPTPRNPEYIKVTGVFEGGGYMSKGIYSPAQDCRMKSNITGRFCPVCEAAIQKTINWYSE